MFWYGPVRRGRLGLLCPVEVSYGAARRGRHGT